MLIAFHSGVTETKFLKNQQNYLIVERNQIFNYFDHTIKFQIFKRNQTQLYALPCYGNSQKQKFIFKNSKVFYKNNFK